MDQTPNTQIVATIVVAGVAAFALGTIAGSIINYISGDLKLNLKPWKK